jgi:type III pantothenate kinase
MTFLAIDVGNTRLKWALYSAPKPGASLIAQGASFLEAIDDLAESSWRKIASPSSMLGSIVAGEGIRRRAEAQLEIWDVEPKWAVSAASACGVTNGYDHPTRLGADRWVALIGARQRILERGEPQPVLVVMVGTAVTVDALDETGRFLGGLILPGFGLMLRALEMGTAGLKAPTGEVVSFPAPTRSPARSTACTGSSRTAPAARRCSS